MSATAKRTSSGASKRSAEPATPSKKPKEESVPEADQPSFSMQPPDWYKYEDDIAKKYGQDELEQMFLKESTVLREALEKIAFQDSKEPLSKSVYVNIAKMRRISRLTTYASLTMQEESAKYLQELEVKYLELQNANSEIQHLQKEINRCLQFSAGDESLDLVPEEEFYAKAPESVSEPDKTKDDEHLKYLARLKWELVERKRLVGTLSEQEGRRSVLLSDIMGKEKRLRDVKPKLQNLIKAAKPVQDLLGVKFTSTVASDQRSLFPVLPPELSVLYVQAEAYRDIMQDEKLQVTICGKPHDAQQYEKVRAKNDDGDSDEEGGSQEPGERRSRTVSALLQSSRNNVMLAHPIYLSMEVGCDEGVTVGMEFRLFQDIKCTFLRFTVSGKVPSCGDVCSATSMFDALYPEDYGTRCPNEVGAAKLAQLRVSLEAFLENYGRPYKFVQALTGEQLAKAGTSGEAGVELADALQDAISLVRDRVTYRLQLATELQLFEKLRIDSFYTEDYPQDVQSELAALKLLSEEDFLSEIPDGAPPREGEGFFAGTTFEHRKKGIRARALIFFPAGYPRESPVFSIKFVGESLQIDQTTVNNSKVKELEHYVNVTCLEEKTNGNSPFAHQMITLLTRCDRVMTTASERNPEEAATK